jgi:hypothetical protein
MAGQAPNPPARRSAAAPTTSPGLFRNRPRCSSEIIPAALQKSSPPLFRNHPRRSFEITPVALSRRSRRPSKGIPVAFPRAFPTFTRPIPQPPDDVPPIHAGTIPLGEIIGPRKRSRTPGQLPRGKTKKRTIETTMKKKIDHNPLLLKNADRQGFAPGHFFSA